MSEQSDPHFRRQRIWHRVVGAAVLLALLVILIPFILDLRDEEGGAISRSNIPERPPGFRVEEIPLSTPEEIRRALQDPPPIETASPQADEPRDVETTAGSTIAPAPAGEDAPGAAPRAYAVQVGSFSSEENALALRDRLRQRGYSAFLDRASIDGRTVFRVLVGPDARREHSDGLRDRVEREMDLKGVVIGYE
jgi:DedD protein